MRTLSTETTFTLTPPERAELDIAVDTYLTQATPFTYESILQFSYGILTRALPPRVLGGLVSLREIEHPGYVLVKGLPTDSVVPGTPSQHVDNVHALLPVASGMLLALTRIVGEPVGYSGEYDGSRISSIMPTTDDANHTSSRGSAHLAMHTEAVHLFPITPSFVSLYCVRPDRSRLAKTLLAHAVDIYSQCPSDLREILASRLFWTRSPRSFGSNQFTSGLISLLDGPGEAPEIHAEISDMTAITPAAREGLARVNDAISECALEVGLEAGDLLIIDNRKLLHGRKEFEPRLDGTDRWLLRTLVMLDLWQFRTFISSYHSLCL